MGFEDRLNPPESKQNQDESRVTGLSFHAEMLSNSDNQLKGGLSNLTAVYANLLPEIPSAFAAQIKSDCLQNPGSTALKVVESTALGLGTAVLLARSPVLAKTLLAGAGISASALMLGGTIRFSREAALASTAEDQARLASSAGKAIGSFAAEALETTPGFILGAGAGYKLSSKIPALSSISNTVRDYGELGARRLVPEGFHYLSPDAKTVLAKQAGGEGANLLRAAEEMTARTPWKGIEEGRFFKVSGNDSIKMSARLPGAESEVMMGKRAEQMFHTHEKALLPTSSDFNSVFGTGVIGVPKQGIITFYEGTGKQAAELSALMKARNSAEAGKAAEAMMQRSFNTLVVDPAKELSVRVALRWDPIQNRMAPASVQALDYSDTVNKLSKWKGSLNIQTIQSSSEALLKPGMTELIRKLGS